MNNNNTQPYAIKLRGRIFSETDIKTIKRIIAENPKGIRLLVKSLCERFLRKLFERKKKQKKPVKILMTGLKTDFFKIYFFLFIRVSAHNFKRD